ncbi:hypothetical protein HC031_29535 [Planosporangium thailandense]|uniref:Uncharacterized protein n=1 Tax=Planosporangium thailandense TaxID=765197 RepID=A0ABX0Y6U8_9ACTN|nr:hypothetical protein [Planosporangium thailandense]NJC73826.1 hypothetical protein [Planosporangium thailandense]
MSENEVPSLQVPEAGDIPAEDATSPQVEHAQDRDQAEGDVNQEEEQQERKP